MAQELKKERFIHVNENISDKDRALLNRIDELVLKDLKLGFDPRALEILDDEKASAQRIDDIKQLISKEIVSVLFQVGSSFHYQKLRMGTTPDFYDVIMRLGTAPSKIFILAMSLFSLVSDDRMRELSARSFATSILSRLFAQERKWKDSLIKEAELMGLFVEIGKVVMLLYRHKMEETHPGEQHFDDLFYETYHTYFGGKLVEKFKLPDFLYEVLIHPDYLSFDEESITVPGLVYSTFGEIDRCFRKHHKLVIQAIMPNQEGNPPFTPGLIIQDRFNAVGLGKFLDLRPLYLPCK